MWGEHHMGPALQGQVCAWGCLTKAWFGAELCSSGLGEGCSFCGGHALFTYSCRCLFFLLLVLS